MFIIGSAEALPILCVRYFRWEREREIQRERRKWRHHFRAKIGDEFTLPLPKIRTIGDALALTLSFAKNSHFSLLPSHSPSLPSRRGHHCGAEIRNEFTLSIAKFFFALFVPPLSNGTSRATNDRKPKTNDQILPSPILFFPTKKWIKLQWNSVITYPQGKWKKVRSNQSTFYPKRDFAHWKDRFHVFTRTICHGRCFSVLNVVHHSLFVRWNRLSRDRELENVPGSWNRNWKAVEKMLVIRKKEPKKGKKVLLEGKLVRNIRFCATFCTSYPKKNVHVFRLAMFVIDGENVITECTY